MTERPIPAAYLLALNALLYKPCTGLNIEPIVEMI
jgi:hypothetical protein